MRLPLPTPTYAVLLTLASVSLSGCTKTSETSKLKARAGVDLLAKAFTQAGPVDEIESIRAMIAFKDGSTMTIEHPAVEEKVKQANESCTETR